MITRDIKDFRTRKRHFEDAIDDFCMLFWEIWFFELPHVNDVAIQNKRIGFDAFEVIQQLSGVAAACAEMYVRNDCYI